MRFRKNTKNKVKWYNYRGMKNESLSFKTINNNYDGINYTTMCFYYLPIIKPDAMSLYCLLYSLKEEVIHNFKFLENFINISSSKILITLKVLNSFDLIQMFYSEEWGYCLVINPLRSANSLKKDPIFTTKYHEGVKLETSNEINREYAKGDLIGYEKIVSPIESNVGFYKDVDRIIGFSAVNNVYKTFVNSLDSSSRIMQLHDEDTIIQFSKIIHSFNLNASTLKQCYLEANAGDQFSMKRLSEAVIRHLDEIDETTKIKNEIDYSNTQKIKDICDKYGFKDFVITLVSPEKQNQMFDICQKLVLRFPDLDLSLLNYLLLWFSEEKELFPDDKVYYPYLEKVVENSLKNGFNTIDKFNDWWGKHDYKKERQNFASVGVRNNRLKTRKSDALDEFFEELDRSHRGERHDILTD